MSTIIVGKNGNHIECASCRKVFEHPGELLKYKDEYYCDSSCLADRLLDEHEEEIEEVWADTEENMKICAEESKYEW